MGWFPAGITLTAEKALSCCRSAGWNICLWGWSLVCVGLARTVGALQATLGLFMIICIPFHIQILILWADHRISWILLHSVNALTELFNDPYGSLPTQDIPCDSIMCLGDTSPCPQHLQQFKPMEDISLLPIAWWGLTPSPSCLYISRSHACSLIKSKCCR